MRIALIMAALAIAAASTSIEHPVSEVTVPEQDLFTSPAVEVATEKSEDVLKRDDREQMFVEHQAHLDTLLAPKKSTPAPKKGPKMSAKKALKVHLAAKKKGAKLMASQMGLDDGVKGNECISNAYKTIKSVIHEVKNAQSILNRMDNGSRCINKGEAAVNSAKRSLARKRADEKRAQKASNAASSVQVEVTVSFSSGNRNCNAFTSSNEWKKARRNKNRKKNDLAKAKQQVKDAINYLNKMKAKAKQDRCKCKRRVILAAKNAVVRARKLTNERKRSITRELMLICLVKARSKGNASARNNAGQACKRQGFPSKYNSSLKLHQTKMSKTLNFHCSPPKHRGRGIRIKDKCGGFNNPKCIKDQKIAFEAHRELNWSRYATYQCPAGWKWASKNEYMNALRGRSGCSYAYYNQCGWRGYKCPQSGNGNAWRYQKYKFRFSDSSSTCQYQHAGNGPGSISGDCGAGNFGGIVCLRITNFGSRDERRAKERNSKERINKERGVKERKTKERNQKNVERANKARAAASERKRKRFGSNGVWYGGKFYRTLAGANQNTRSLGCESGWYGMPSGCRVAPNNMCQYMGARYYWGTSVIACNTQAWGCQGYSPGNIWQYSRQWGQSGNSFRTGTCNLRLLLQCTP
jgi:hypothetical protein